jgi:glycosyltransferase involved in cell wall biosynthesis
MHRAPAILQLVPALAAGGVERGTVEIAEAIRDAGFRPIVASQGGRLVPELEALGAEHVTLPLGAKTPWGIARNARAVEELVRREGVAILHARSRAPAWAGWLAARRTGARFVTTYHGVYSEGFPGKRLYNGIMARGERVIAISRFIEGVLRERHGADPARIRTILRGVDLRRFEPGKVRAAQVAAMRAAWGVPASARVVLLPGRLTRWKGGTVALEALPRLPEDVVLVLAGDSQGRDGFAAQLTGRAEALGLAQRVRLPGHVVDMPAALLAADVVLHASTEPEAFGRVVTEAQAMARPIVASDAGGPVETVEDGVTGWRVPPGDPAALAAALNRVLAMPEAERRAVGEAARLRVPTLAEMQAKTIAVYRELL